MAVLSEAEKSEVKKAFNSWMEVKDQMDGLKTELKSCIDVAKAILKKKTGVAKYFSELRKQRLGEESSLEQVLEIDVQVGLLAASENQAPEKTEEEENA